LRICSTGYFTFTNSWKALGWSWLSNGLGFVFEDVWLRRVGRRLECEAVNLLPNGQLTGLVARELIQHAQAVVERLIAGSPTFAATVETWEVRYSVIEDYGMGTAT